VPSSRGLAGRDLHFNAESAESMARPGVRALRPPRLISSVGVWLVGPAGPSLVDGWRPTVQEYRHKKAGPRRAGLIRLV